MATFRFRINIVITASLVLQPTQTKLDINLACPTCGYPQVFRWKACNNSSDTGFQLLFKRFQYNISKWDVTENSVCTSKFFSGLGNSKKNNRAPHLMVALGEFPHPQISPYLNRLLFFIFHRLFIICYISLLQQLITVFPL